MKGHRRWTMGVLALSAVLLSVQAIQAAPVTRANFGPTATEFDFTGVSGGSTTVTSGILTVSDGVVDAATWAWPGTAMPDYYDGADSTPIRLDFSSPISAVGMDFIANNQDTTLTLYDGTDTAIESYTVLQAGLPTYLSEPYGFIGIDYGSNAVSYAIIDTPLLGNELYIDNIIFDTAPAVIPAPGAVVLGMVGAGLVGWLAPQTQNIVNRIM